VARFGGAAAPDLNEASLTMPTSPQEATPSLWRPLGTPIFRDLLLADVASDVGTFMQGVGAAWLMVSLGAGDVPRKGPAVYVPPEGAATHGRMRHTDKTAFAPPRPRSDHAAIASSFEAIRLHERRPRVAAMPGVR
jgi:hypothetical protein